MSLPTSPPSLKDILHRKIVVEWFNEYPQLKKLRNERFIDEVTYKSLMNIWYAVSQFKRTCWNAKEWIPRECIVIKNSKIDYCATVMRAKDHLSIKSYVYYLSAHAMGEPLIERPLLEMSHKMIQAEKTTNNAVWLFLVKHLKKEGFIYFSSYSPSRQQYLNAIRTSIYYNWFHLFKWFLEFGQPVNPLYYFDQILRCVEDPQPYLDELWTKKYRRRVFKWKRMTKEPEMKFYKDFYIPNFALLSKNCHLHKVLRFLVYIYTNVDYDVTSWLTFPDPKNPRQSEIVAIPERDRKLFYTIVESGTDIAEVLVKKEESIRQACKRIREELERNPLFPVSITGTGPIPYIPNMNDPETAAWVRMVQENEARPPSPKKSMQEIMTEMSMHVYRDQFREIESMEH